MNDIWVSGDWHLFNKDDRPGHRNKNIFTLESLKTNYWTMIDPSDTFIMLGDIADAEYLTREQQSQLETIISGIPGYKVLCKGNHDTMEDKYYMVMGFHEVCDICKMHHMIFSHKPVKVKLDEINVHSHLHGAKDTSLNGFQHIDAWLPFINGENIAKPIRLQDLLDLATTLNHNAEPKWAMPDVYQSGPYMKISELQDYSNTDIVDLSDRLVLAPEDTDSDQSIMSESYQPDTILDEILFGDTDSTKYFEADDDSYDDNLKKTEYSDAKQTTKVHHKNTVMAESVCMGKHFIVETSDTENFDDTISTKAADLTFYIGEFKVGTAKVSSVDTGKAFLYGLNVAEPYRKQGLGTAMVEHCMRQYQLNEAVVRTDNTPMIHLLSKFGFRVYKEFSECGTPMVDMMREFPTSYPVCITENSLRLHVYTEPLYRITYNGIGIYEAYKKVCSFDEWRSFINSDAATWLDVPKIYNRDINHTSYFTKRGYELFQKNTYPIIIQKLNKRNIKVDQVVLGVKPVYEDLYQVVVPNPVNESLYNSTINSNHVQKGSLSLSNLQKIKITEAWRKQNRNKYPFLKHISSNTDEIEAVAWIDQNGDLVAALSVDKVPTKRDKIWIHNIHIVDKYRGYGLSKQILQYASQFHANALAVKIDNKLAQKVYLDYGFKFGTDESDIMGNSRLMYLNETDSLTEGSLKEYKRSDDNKKIDRSEKKELADKYGLRAVGQVSYEEDKERMKTPEEKLKEKRDKRNEQLKRARSIKKRKKIVRDIKSKIPFIKNEDTAVDDSEVPDIEIEDNKLYGPKKDFFHNYNKPSEYNSSAEKLSESATGMNNYRVERQNKYLRFNNDVIDETTYKNPNQTVITLQGQHFTLLSKDIIDEFISINPESLDRAKLASTKNIDELKALFHQMVTGYRACYDNYSAAIDILSMIAKNRTAFSPYNIDDLFPKSLTRDQYQDYIKTRLHEFDDVYTLFELILTENIRLTQIDIQSAGPDVIRSAKKLVDQNVKIKYITKDGITTKTIVFDSNDFQNINFNCKVYVEGSIAETGDGINAPKFRPSDFIIRASRYNYIIVTHGSMKNGAWVISPIVVEGVVCTTMDKLLSVIHDNISNRENSPKILLYCCNPGGVNLKPYEKKYGLTIDYADSIIDDNGTKVIMESVAYAGTTISISYLKSIHKSYIRRLKHLTELADYYFDHCNALFMPNSVHYLDIQDDLSINKIKLQYDKSKYSSGVYYILQQIQELIDLFQIFKQLTKNRIMNISECAYGWARAYLPGGYPINPPLNNPVIYPTISECMEDASATSYCRSIVNSDTIDKGYWILEKQEASDCGYTHKDSYTTSDMIAHYKESLTESVNTNKIPKTLYHGSPYSFKTLKTHDSGISGNHVFATSNRSYALAYSGAQWSDFEVNQSCVGNIMYLTEIIPGKFNEIFNRPGFIHVVLSNGFRLFHGVEYIADHDVPVIRTEKIENVLDELRKSRNVKLFHYPSLPPFIKDRNKYLKQMAAKYGNHDVDKIISIIEKKSIQESYKFELMDKSLRFLGESDEPVVAPITKWNPINESFAENRSHQGYMETVFNIKEMNAAYRKRTKNWNATIPGFPDCDQVVNLFQDILDNYNKIAPWAIDAYRVSLCTSGEQLIQYFKDHMKELKDNYDSYTSSIEVLDKLIELDIPNTGYAPIIPTNLSEDQFREYIKLRLDEMSQIEAFVMAALKHNLQMYGVDLADIDRQVANSTDQEVLKQLVQHVKKNEQKFIKVLKHQGHTTYKYELSKLLEHGDVYIADTVYNNSAYRSIVSPNRLLIRSMKYDYIIYTHGHGAASDGSFGIDPIVIDKHAFYTVDELLSYIDPNGTKAVLIMSCNPDQVILDIEKPYHRNVAYGTDRVIMENVAASIDQSVPSMMKAWKKYTLAAIQSLHKTEKALDTLMEQSHKKDILVCPKEINVIDIEPHHKPTMKRYRPDSVDTFMKNRTCYYQPLIQYLEKIYFSCAIIAGRISDYVNGKLDESSYGYQWKINFHSGILPGYDPSASRVYRDLSECMLDASIGHSLYHSDRSDISILDGVYHPDGTLSENISIDDQKSFEVDAAMVESAQEDLFSHVYLKSYIPQQLRTIIHESVSHKSEKLYPVYIVLVHSGTTVSNIIKNVSHSEYSHASISFDSSLDRMYSFARKDPANPFLGGFRYESIGKGFYEKKEIPYAVYMVPCTESQIKKMKKRLEYFIKNESKFTFDFIGLVTNYLGIERTPEHSWFCSRFVSDILNAGAPSNQPYVAKPSLQDPDDFMHDVYAHFVVHGKNLMKYDRAKVDKITTKILREEKLRRIQLTEQVIFDFDFNDPYNNAILEYQLTNMDESAIDDFLSYMRSFHVQLDRNGNVILTRRVYNQLDRHFHETQRMLKIEKKAGDIEGIKSNLAKLYYMIGLVDEQYLKRPSLNTNSKTVKKDLQDMRSVMINVFQQYLQHVEELDPSFNFQSYYDSSIYGKETRIPVSAVTAIGKSLKTLL